MLRTIAVGTCHVADSGKGLREAPGRFTVSEGPRGCTVSTCGELTLTAADLAVLVAELSAVYQRLVANGDERAETSYLTLPAKL